MADNRRHALISSYERYKTAAEALQEELQLSFSQPGLPFDRDLTLTHALLTFTFNNQHVLTWLERLVLGCYVGQPRVRRLSQTICAGMNAAAAGVEERLEGVKIDEGTEAADQSVDLEDEIGRDGTDAEDVVETKLDLDKTD